MSALSNNFTTSRIFVGGSANKRCFIFDWKFQSLPPFLRCIKSRICTKFDGLRFPSFLAASSLCFSPWVVWYFICGLRKLGKYWRAGAPSIFSALARDRTPVSKTRKLRRTWPILHRTRISRKSMSLCFQAKETGKKTRPRCCIPALVHKRYATLPVCLGNS